MSGFPEEVPALPIIDPEVDEPKDFFPSYNIVALLLRDVADYVTENLLEALRAPGIGSLVATDGTPPAPPPDDGKTYLWVNLAGTDPEYVTTQVLDATVEDLMDHIHMRLTQTAADARYRQLSVPVPQADVDGLTAALATKVEDTDPRLSDARPPIEHGHSIAEVTGLAAALDEKQDAGDYILDDDPRLSNARPPTAHAESHAAGGSDELTPAAIGAAAAEHGTHVIVLTQAAYEALDPPVPGQIYITYQEG